MGHFPSFSWFWDINWDPTRVATPWQVGVPSPSNRFLFNGDICDRGENAAEIWALLLGDPETLRAAEWSGALRGRSSSKHGIYHLVI